MAVAGKPNKRLCKITLLILKVIPMLLALCSVVNMLFDVFMVDSFIMSAIGGMSLLPMLFIYIASFAFGFCSYHRMFIYYVFVTNAVTWIDYLVGIPVSNKTLFMFHFIILGLFLFLVLYFYRKEKCCKQ